MRHLISCCLASSLLLACNRPSAEACEEARTNVRRLVDGNPNARAAPSDVEECQAKDKAAAVECQRAAKSVEDLARCIALNA